MTVFFIILALALLAAGIFAYLNSTSGVLPAACFVGMLLCLGIAGVSSANKMAKSKIETLSAAGIEYIDKDTVYNMSQAELDKCYSIVTLDGTYYYKFEEK